MIRLKASIIKEIWALIRDGRFRIMLVLPPLMQLLLFSYAATLEVKNVDIAVLDLSHGVHSAEILSQISGSPNFRHIIPVHSREELHRKIDRQAVLAAIIFSPDFDARLGRGQPASVGIVLDGRRSNASQIVNAYIGQIVGSVSAELQSGRAQALTRSQVTHWFNPNLEFIWFNLPALLVIVVATSVLALTAQSVARERELGTFDQLMVSPLRVHEILIGKIVPPVIVGMFNGLLFYCAARFFFGVPFAGSFVLFVLSLAIFMLSLTGLGLFISALSMTQQQAFLGSFVASVPIIMLSGFSSPIENMPHWLQFVTLANPARYFLEISIGIFLKAMPLSMVAERLWPLLIIGIITLAAAARLFRARME
ncbi:MAG: ABC transporter permease [Sphingobium sp.]